MNDELKSIEQNYLFKQKECIELLNEKIRAMELDALSKIAELARKSAEVEKSVMAVSFIKTTCVRSALTYSAGSLLT